VHRLISNILTATVFGPCYFKYLEIIQGMDKSDCTTFEDVMTALGGNGPVGDLTGAKASTVSMWKKAGSFPSNTFLVMGEALSAMGKSAPASLWNMKASAEQESAA
jgi:hypothetical protein